MDGWMDRDARTNKMMKPKMMDRKNMMTENETGGKMKYM